MSSTDEVTQLLLDWNRGDQAALERLMPVVYDELRRLAKYHLRAERPDHTLQPTALVNEAYLRLVDQRRAQWQNRAHFFAIAAQVMRRILVDYARRHRSDKRGGGLQNLSLDEAIVISEQRAGDLVALDEALNELAILDPQQAKMVELRFFGGLSIEETAQALGVSPATIKREWSMARAWLYHQIKKG